MGWWGGGGDNSSIETKRGVMASPHLLLRDMTNVSHLDTRSRRCGWYLSPIKMPRKNPGGGLGVGGGSDGHHHRGDATEEIATDPVLKGLTPPRPPPKPHSCTHLSSNPLSISSALAAWPPPFPSPESPSPASPRPSPPPPPGEEERIVEFHHRPTPRHHPDPGIRRPVQPEDVPHERLGHLHGAEMIPRRLDPDGQSRS